jgi:hypothetical protein
MLIFPSFSRLSRHAHININALSSAKINRILRTTPERENERYIDFLDQYYARFYIWNTNGNDFYHEKERLLHELSLSVAYRVAGVTSNQQAIKIIGFILAVYVSAKAMTAEHYSDFISIGVVSIILSLALLQKSKQYDDLAAVALGKVYLWVQQEVVEPEVNQEAASEFSTYAAQP